MVQVGFAKQDLEDALQPKKPIQEERIEAIALYIASGAQRCVWVTLDFMDFDLLTVNTLTASIQAAIGLKSEHIHIVTTHNHGGGEPDLMTLSDLTVQCVQNAVENAVPAQMRWSHCKADRQLNFIRRYPVPELGGVNTLFYGAAEENGYNSAPFAQHVIDAVKNGRLSYSGQTETTRPAAPLAPADDDIYAIQFCDKAGNTIGTVVRFSAHAVCCNRDDAYSSDYPYHVRKCIEKAFGGICVFWNGPCGDIAPGMTLKTDGVQVKLGRFIAESASLALKTAVYAPIFHWRDASITLRLPVREQVRTGTVSLPDTIPEALPARRAYLEDALLMELMDFLRKKYQQGEECPTDTIAVSLGFLVLNNLTITGFPGETFSVTGKALQAAFPEKHICTVTEHGRTVMYLPPAADCARGGYESVCRTTTNAAEELLRSKAIAATAAFVL